MLLDLLLVFYVLYSTIAPIISNQLSGFENVSFPNLTQMEEIWIKCLIMQQTVLTDELKISPVCDFRFGSSVFSDFFMKLDSHKVRKVTKPNF